MIVLQLQTLLFGLVLVQASIKQKCHPENELPCNDGGCIKNEEWCNRKFDCEDGSDEYHCYKESCPDKYFHCNNKRCVPESAFCNGYDNCGDGSDEICNGTRRYLRRSGRTKREPLNLFNDTFLKKIVTKAAKYLLSKRNSDYGWGSFTPRAMIALAFADGVFKVSDHEKMLMKKHLDVEILLNLKRNKRNLNLADLALYINALYATCQNPRNFNGLDLVDLLLSETKRELQTDFNLPLVLMTLCIANESNSFSGTHLISMYDDVRNDRIGFKAVVVMAMTACRGRVNSRLTRREMETRMDRFSGLRSQVGSFDIYTDALILQALNGMRRNIRHDLWTRQLPDGSFGDLLATYYAIPVMLNMSLLNLKCNGPRYDESSLGMPLSNNSLKKNIAYSLWISQDEEIESHTMYITMEGNRTLYDVMMEAKFKDPMYSFTYDQTNEGKFVYSFGGLPNDAEAGMYWILHRGAGKDYMESKNGPREEIHQGIEQILPEDGSHFIFWRKPGFR